MRVWQSFDGRRMRRRGSLRKGAARAARMKQAKADAAKDIDAFRQEHMKELEKIKAEKTGASGGSDAAGTRGQVERGDQADGAAVS